MLYYPTEGCCKIVYSGAEDVVKTDHVDAFSVAATVTTVT